MLRAHRKKPKKRKAKALDPIKEAERAKRFAEIAERRQTIINEVRGSLQRRRAEKVAIRNARVEKEARLRLKNIRDADKSRSEKMMLQIRQDLSTIVEDGVKCVRTSTIVWDKIKYDGRGTLTVKGAKYKIRNNLHIVGWGREAIAMSSELERIVGKQLRRGFVVVPRKSISMMWSFPEAFPKLDSHITYVEAGTKGQPDERSVETTRRIAEYCKRLRKRDILIVMLSRGVDDLLCYPTDMITLKDKLRLLKRLTIANATDAEIDAVRNKLSAIRGGDLARLAYPARVIVLTTSDVSAEPTPSLSGGPCTYDPKGSRAQAILLKYNLADRVTQSIRELVAEAGPRETAADGQLDEAGRYKFVNYYVIACNADAMECMAVEAFALGLFPVKLNSTCSGNVQQFAREYAKMASLMILAVEGKVNKMEMYEMMRDSPVCPLTAKKVIEIFPVKDKWGLGLCLLLGGRASVDLGPNPGKGGPNQELALYFSLYWYMRTVRYPILDGYTVWFLGGNSRGNDGNTRATGAFAYKCLAADLYPEYRNAKSKHNTAFVKWRKLADEKRQDTDTFIAQKEALEGEKLKRMHYDILPDRVLRENNTSLMFRSVNDGDDLFELKTGNYYTFTDVGHLHAIRIVRFQCNCIGQCHGSGEALCSDKECPVNRTMSAEVVENFQYCCHFGKRKDV